MGREELIRVSSEEKELLEKVRGEEFGTDSVPLGEVLELACQRFLD